MIRAMEITIECRESDNCYAERHHIKLTYLPSLVRPSVRPFARSLVRSFLPQLTQQFTHSFASSLTYYPHKLPRLSYCRD